MILKTITTTLTDNSKVYDVAIRDEQGGQIYHIPCVDQNAAEAFIRGIAELVEAYTVDTITVDGRKPIPNGGSEMVRLNQKEAEILALNDKGYRARKLGDEWIVWCDESDHEVTFDDAALMQAKINAAITFTSEDDRCKPDEIFDYTRADEVAECWPGLSEALYLKLWNQIVPLQKKIPNIEDSGPHDHVGHESLAAHWHILALADQIELNALAAQQHEEYERWRASVR